MTLLPTIHTAERTHFKTWRGQRFDYHRPRDVPRSSSSPVWALRCTFVRRSAVNFRSLPLLLSGLAKDVLEVESGVYWLNGVLNADCRKVLGIRLLARSPPTSSTCLGALGRSRAHQAQYLQGFCRSLGRAGPGANFLNSVGLMGDFKRRTCLRVTVKRS
jgi:hypothetical protein